ncbi:MAG: TetR/AcrR family transcriptional regulator [Methyloprofundus sp.]|nr:TetR/AcrR family transcriptional regulator [Methyloprofundus sp.]MDT8425689.1 TetR/AcrR family transcriptional regulator [Methyloprofundus sp.]
MARRSEHSQEEIKQMILEAAEDIVQEYGFSALKVRKIAADIGYTVGSIYMVFTGVDDLIMHIKARTWQKLSICLEQEKTEPATFKVVENMALAYLDFTVRNKGLWSMLFEHQLPIGKEVPKFYMEEYEQLVVFVTQLFKELDNQCSDAQVLQAARTLVNSMQGVCMQLVIQEGTMENIELARAQIVFLVNCVMRGWVNGVN